jgi:hypothetical protein
MALPGEVTGGKLQTKCSECGTVLTLSVCHSGAGYYLGYWCPECGPYGRESGYMTEEQAEKELAVLQAGSQSIALRDTGYHG